MAKKRPPPAAPGNRLLARLAPAEFRRLLPLLEPVEFAPEQVLYQPRGPIDHAYFLTGAVCSALTVMRDGSAIEVAAFGSEGLLGHTAAAGGKTSPNKVVVQLPGGALRIGARALREAPASGGPLRDVLAAYDDAFRAQVSQAVACNGL